MENVNSDDREQLDQAANALMASLRQSRDLNIEFRQALQKSEASEGRRARVFEILREMISGVSRS